MEDRNFTDIDVFKSIYEMVDMYKQDPIYFAKAVQVLVKSPIWSQNTHTQNMVKDIDYIISLNHDMSTILIDYILFTTSKVFSVSSEQIKHISCRDVNVPLARQMFCYILHEHRYSRKQICDILGYATISTARHNIITIEFMIKTKDIDVCRYYNQIKKELILNTYLNA